MTTYSCSPRPLALIAQAKLRLRQAAIASKDTQLKSDADRIATELDRLIERSSRTNQGEQ